MRAEFSESQYFTLLNSILALSCFLQVDNHICRSPGIAGEGNKFLEQAGGPLGVWGAAREDRSSHRVPSPAETGGVSWDHLTYSSLPLM